MKALKYVGGFLALIVVAVIGLMVYVTAAFPKVSPALEMRVEPARETVERGRYLANNVMICIDCHSTRDWTKFSGPIVHGSEGRGGERFGPEMELPGTIFAKNITPAAIGDWTDGEIYRMITTGVNRDNGAAFPLMPYLSYRYADPEDVKAVVAYLRTLAPIENQTPPTKLDFPVNFLVRTMPTDPEPMTRPDPSDTLAHGKYMTTIAACVACHTPIEKGALVAGMEYAGGAKFPMPGGDLRSMNITPDEETGIGTWTKEQFVARFKANATPEAKNIAVGPNDFNTIMPWTLYAGMSEEDLGAIYEYLRTVTPIKHKVERWTPRAPQ